MAVPIEAAHKWAQTLSPLALVAIMVLYLAEMRLDKKVDVPTQNDVTMGEMSRAVSRVEGAVNTLSQTLTAQIIQIGKDVSDATRRMDSMDAKLNAQAAVLQDHGQAIRALQERKP